MYSTTLNARNLFIEEKNKTWMDGTAPFPIIFPNPWGSCLSEYYLVDDCKWPNDTWL